MLAETWWLHITDQTPENGTPSMAAFSHGHATRFESLGDAIRATADVPPGKYPWIFGDDVMFAPDQIKPIRKLLYRPED